MGRRRVSVFSQLLFLNGLAIVAMVAHHAIGYSTTAMIWWADRWRPVSVPNYDQLDTLFYDLLLVIGKLANFAVPAFLFASGVFATYMLHGASDQGQRWKRVGPRVLGLLTTYMIWQVMYAVYRPLNGESLTWRILAQDVVVGGRFWFVYFLAQLYLLSPLLMRMAKHRPKLLLTVSALPVAGYIGVYYLTVAKLLSGADTSLLDYLVYDMPFDYWPKLLLFFVGGMVCGMRLGEVRAWTHRYRWPLLAATVVLAGLALLESEIVYRNTEWYEFWSGFSSIPGMLYVVSFIFCFLGFSDARILGFSHVYEIGKASLGIYLANRFVLEFTARALQKFAPRSLAYPAVFYLLLVISAVEVPILARWVIAKSPARRLNRYLFT